MLGQVDLDSFVDAHVSTAQDFEENYKVVRARRREAEKLPEIIKVSLQESMRGALLDLRHEVKVQRRCEVSRQVG